MHTRYFSTSGLCSWAAGRGSPIPSLRLAWIHSSTAAPGVGVGAGVCSRGVFKVGFEPGNSHRSSMICKPGINMPTARPAALWRRLHPPIPSMLEIFCRRGLAGALACSPTRRATTGGYHSIFFRSGPDSEERKRHRRLAGLTNQATTLIC